MLILFRKTIFSDFTDMPAIFVCQTVCKHFQAINVIRQFRYSVFLGIVKSGLFSLHVRLPESECNNDNANFGNIQFHVSSPSVSGNHQQKTTLFQISRQAPVIFPDTAEVSWEMQAVEGTHKLLINHNINML